MNPQASQLQLRDIHLPDAVSWWPPAPGYWLLLALLMISLMSFWLMRKRYRQRAVKRAALKQLTLIKQNFRQNHDTQQLVSQLSALLRRAAISTFPRANCAALTGQQWLQWLDTGLKNQPLNFNSSAGQLLVSAPYQKTIASEQTEELLKLCQQWLSQLPAPQFSRDTRSGGRQ